MEKVFNDIQESLNTFETLFSTIDEETINQIPFEGSWTAAQVAEHLVLANGGFTEVLHGPVTETSRPADKMVEQLKNDFMDFSTRMKSPDQICPPLKSYAKEELTNQLSKIKHHIVYAAQHLDLTKTCSAFELPVYGSLTRLEAIYFVVYHSKRHSHQLQNIIHVLKEGKNEKAMGGS